jgi:hypothetical protein
MVVEERWPSMQQLYVGQPTLSDLHSVAEQLAARLAKLHDRLQAAEPAMTVDGIDNPDLDHLRRQVRNTRGALRRLTTAVDMLAGAVHDIEMSR